jgi:peptidoglycan/xylan/chitin deacetylase (PgdA/CDA1 family)
LEIRGGLKTETGVVPILMYHALVSNGETFGICDPGELLYMVDESHFANHLRFLKEEGYHSILLQDLLDWQRAGRKIPQRSIVITFDDGHQSNITRGFPLLESYGFRAEFFITTGCIGREGWMSKEDIRWLKAKGMGIGSHSVSHPMLDELNEPDIYRELVGSRQCLENILGETVTTFAAPGGRFPKHAAKQAARAGYEVVCTSRLGVNKKETDPFQLKRIAMKRDIMALDNRLLAKGHNGYRHFFSQIFLDRLKRDLGNRRYNILRQFLFSRMKERTRFS